MHCASALVSFPKQFVPAAKASPRHRGRPAAASVSTGVDYADYQLLFSSQPAESASPVALRAVEGAIPADFPLGAYYLVGPGIIDDGHGTAVNPLDGHGYLRAFRFEGGGNVTYAARYVETEAAREERDDATGKWIFRRPGMFSSLKAGRVAVAPGWANLSKNVANTTVMGWGGRLFCLWELGQPYEIDPATLATVGPVDLIRSADDRRRPGFVAPILKSLLQRLSGTPPKRTLAHFKMDAERRRLIVVSCDCEDFALPHSNFTFYEFDLSFELKQKKEFLVLDHLMIHDWAFTDSHYVLMGNRIKLNIPGFLLAAGGFAPMISTILPEANPATTPIYLLPRFSDETIPTRDWRVPVMAPSLLWTLHVGNAFEERDGTGNTEFKIQASSSSYNWFNLGKMFGYEGGVTPNLDPSFMNVGKQELAHLLQVSIVIDAKGSCRRCSIEYPSTQWNNPSDLMTVNPRNSGQRNKFLYASSTSGSRKSLPYYPYDTLIKVDFSDGTVKSWFAGIRKFIGEPMFIPKWAADEDDGYIAVVEYDVSKSICFLVVLDAKRIGYDDAVVAKLLVPEHLRFPYGFHGFWDAK